MQLIILIILLYLKKYIYEKKLENTILDLNFDILLFTCFYYKLSMKYTFIIYVRKPASKSSKKLFPQINI